MCAAGVTMELSAAQRLQAIALQLRSAWRPRPTAAAANGETWDRSVITSLSPGPEATVALAARVGVRRLQVHPPPGAGHRGLVVLE